MDEARIYLILRDLEHTARERQGKPLSAWPQIWKQRESDSVARLLHQPVMETQLLAGQGGEETALLVAYLGYDALERMQHLSEPSRQEYLKGLRRASESLVSTLPRFRKVPNRHQTVEEALKTLQASPESCKAVSLAATHRVTNLLPHLPGTRPLDFLPSLNLKGATVGFEGQNLVAPAHVVLFHQKPEQDQLAELLETRPDASPLIAIAPEIDHRAFKQVQSQDKMLYGLEFREPASCYNQFAWDLGTTVVQGPEELCLPSSVKAASIYPKNLTILSPRYPTTAGDFPIGMITGLQASDPQWASLDSCYRAMRASFDAGVIDAPGLSRSTQMVQDQIATLPSGQTVGAFSLVRSANRLGETISSRNLSIPALTTAVNNATTAVTSVLGKSFSEPLGIATKTWRHLGTEHRRPLTTRSPKLGLSDDVLSADYVLAGRGVTRGHSPSHKAPPVELNPPPKQGSELDAASAVEMALAEDGPRRDDWSLSGGEPPPGKPPTGGPEGDPNRRLDVLLVGDVIPGCKVILSAIVRLLTSSTSGQWKEDITVDPDAPMTFKIAVQGFALDGPDTLNRAIPKGSDSEPAAFHLQVLEANERWVELCLFQHQSLVAEVTLTRFNLRQIEQQQTLKHTAAVDLNLSIDRRGEIWANSPRHRENLSDYSMGTLTIPDEKRMEELNERVEALYQQKDPDQAERQLRLLGAELGRCLPQDLQDRLAGGGVETLLVRHQVDHDFPFELTLLTRGEDEFFLADRVIVCRWFRGFESSPSAASKKVEKAAVLLGDVATNIAEQQMLPEICQATKIFSSPEDVRTEIFMTNSFDLMHFLGHCSYEDPSNVSLALKEGDLPVREIGLLAAERRFEQSSPVVVINGCGTAKPSLSLFGKDSLPARFLGLNARAFLGTFLPVEETIAHALSRLFYQKIAEGKTLGEALFESRQELLNVRHGPEGRELSQEEQVWRRISLRSYCLFAHPMMTLSFSQAA